MTAPARVPGTSVRSRTTAVPERIAEETPPRLDPGTRRRSGASQRAYERRAQRQNRLLRVVPERTPGAGPRTPFVLLVMGLLTAGIVGTLWLSTTATADSYRLEQVRQANKALSEREEQLRHQVAAQDSPASLAEAARTLGMVPAGDPARLLVRPDGSVAVISGAKPAVVPGSPPAASSTPAPTPAPNADAPQQGDQATPQQPAQQQPAQQQPAQPDQQTAPAAQAAPTPPSEGNQ